MKKKVVFIQLRTLMTNEDIKKMETELSNKTGYKVVLLPCTVNMDTMRIV